MRPRVAVILAVTITLSFAAVLSHAAEPSPSEIFETLHQQFVAIKSLDVAAQYARVPGDVEPDPKWTVDSLRWGPLRDTAAVERAHSWTKGAYFRYSRESQLFGPVECSYDGNRYQVMEMRGRYLRLLEGEEQFHAFSPGPDSQIPAVFRPFDFVFFVTDKPMSLATLQEAETWSTLSKLAEMREDQTVDGQRCKVVEITVRDHPRYGIERTVMFFAADKQYFPVRYERYIGKDIHQVSQAHDVKEGGYCRRPANAKPAFFAARSTMEDFDSMGSGRRTSFSLIEVDVDNLRLNGEVPDAFFTIARSEAIAVSDARNRD